MTVHNTNQKESTRGILGIDAGGTFTDLVFYQPALKAITARAKVPTDHDNLAETIKSGIQKILNTVDPAAIGSINLASTLATNAIVENRLKRAALILIGYDLSDIDNFRKQDDLGTDEIYFLDGGHKTDGSEKAPLDLKKAEEIIDSLDKNLRCVAVSGYFSVRNHTHENAVADLIRKKRPDLYLSLGHDLSTSLNAMKRATTAALNAGLIPVIMDLMTAVQKICLSQNIQAPLMIVRGDGSLVNYDWACTHPIEMVMSGPAASACGGWWLAAHRNFDAGSADDNAYAVADIGGTTTDIIEIHQDGRPVVCDDGAEVGGHRTLIRAIDIKTFGLGGDSQIMWHEDELQIGPRRVLPLCRAASAWPSVINELVLKEDGSYDDRTPLIIAANPSSDLYTSDPVEAGILNRLKNGPLRLCHLIDTKYMLDYYMPRLNSMEEKGLILYCSFTPTDALHAEGKLDLWNKKASLMGAAVLCQMSMPEIIHPFCGKVLKLVSEKISEAILEKSLEGSGYKAAPSGTSRDMISWILHKESLFIGQDAVKNATENIPFHFSLNRQVIGAGAPAWAFIPFSADLLHTECLLPKDSDVAGAIGAAVGTFRMEYHVDIYRNETRTRIYSPLGVTDLPPEMNVDVEEYTKQMVIPWLEERAKKAGAVNPTVVCRDSDAEHRKKGAVQRLLFCVKG